MSIKILPSILASDFAQLGHAVEEAEQGGADAIHIDVMDGHFVPNLTIGPPVVAALRPVTSLILDVHLMIENPSQLVPHFAKAGADILTVHVEACKHLHRVVHQIKEHGMKAGIALNPATPLVMIEEVLHEVDLVLIMTVNPGFGGQSFIHSMQPKIRRLREMLNERGLDQVRLQVDGGVNEKTISLVAEAGATWLVAGSAIYRGNGSVGECITRLRALAESSHP